MSIFKKKSSVEYFVEDPVENRFDSMMALVKDLSKADYKRLKKAMDLGYDAYQTVRNIESDDDSVEKAAGEFILHEKEGK